MGAGQDRTVLNSFSLKSVLGLQGFFFFFFSFTFIFLKSDENEQVGCGLQEWWRLTLLVLFPLGPPSGGEAGGQEAPCKHLDLGWVRGPGWRSECRSRHGLWGTQQCPPHPRTDAQEGGTVATADSSNQARLPTGRPVAAPPRSGAEGGDRELRTEEGEGESGQGAGRGHGRGAWSSHPHLPRGWGQRSRRWPTVPGPLPLRRGRSPSGCS